MKHYLFLINIFLLLQGCTDEKGESVVIAYYQYDALKDSVTTSLTIKREQEYTDYLFGVEEINNTVYMMDPIVRIFHKYDSMIHYNEDAAYLKSTMLFKDVNINRIVKKYKYNPEAEDDAGYIFILDDNRILGYNSAAWDLYHVFYYQDTKVDSLLQADTSGFFYRRNK